MKERNGYYWDPLAFRQSRRVKLMSKEARWIYRDVMDEIWLQGPIPNDPDKIAVILGLPSDLVLNVWAEIHDCLVPTRKNPDLFTSERLEKERNKRNKIAKLRRKVGQRGGETTQAKKRVNLQLVEPIKQNDQAIASDLVEQNSTKAKAIQVTSTSASNKKEELKYIAFGQFSNVQLTADEYEKLLKRFGGDGTRQRIEALSEGIASKGYKYKSHYATILTWDRKNGVKTNGHIDRGERNVQTARRLLSRLDTQDSGSGERGAIRVNPGGLSRASAETIFGPDPNGSSAGDRRMD